MFRIPKRSVTGPRIALAAATTVALLMTGTSVAAAGTLATETTDWAYPNAPTFAAVPGSQTVTGTLGPTPTDGQDPFTVDIPATLEVLSVAYSGPAGPHNLVGCGLTGVGNLNQTFSSNNSGCQLNWFINTNFAVSASPWTVTIVTQNKPVSTDTEPPSWSVASVSTTTDIRSGVAVSYTATATDNVGVASSSCLPTSGSVFPVGVTTVNCTASDAAGNAGRASFTVTVTLEDTTPPDLTVPANRTVEATGPAGAVVDYIATATDNDVIASIECSPAPGSTFPLGDTTVTCTATDASGNQASDDFTVTVRDTTAPSLTVPDDIISEATGTDGATVDFTPTADDTVGVASLECTPASGSTFPLGDTTVTCTATDTSGNQASDDFTVTVTVDATSVDVIASSIEAQGLPNGVERSLLGPLSQAKKIAGDNNPRNDGAVCNKLDSFAAHVPDRVADGSISTAYGAELTTFARAIGSSLGCV